MAFYKYFWDLANSTTYSSHVVGTFDRNTNTGGGIFRWVGGVNNATITDIPGIRIKPVNAVTGYWLRSFDGPISVSWFGCQNTMSIPNTYAQLGVSQLQVDSMYGPGFATTTDNYDTSAIRYAMKFIDDMIALNASTTTNNNRLPVNSNSLTFEPKTYHLTRGVDLPKGSSTYAPPYVTENISIIIDGNGASIKKANNNQFDFFVRYPIDQNEAIQMSTTSIIFKNFVANGLGGVWQSSGYSFLVLTSSNGATIEELNLQNFDIGVRVEFSNNVTINKINTSGIATNSVLCKDGGWSGAVPAQSCNELKISKVCVFDTIGQNECIKVEHGNSINIENTSIGGPGTFGHGIYVDTEEIGYVGSGSSVKIYDTSYDLVQWAGFSFGGWTNALITLKNVNGLVTTSRYCIDTVYPYGNGYGSFSSIMTSPSTIINVEIDPAATPGRKPVIELRNLLVISDYPNTPALPYNGTPLPPPFRNVGDITWNFQTVDFGGDPTVDSAAILDPLNLLWVTIAPATVPTSADLVYVNPLSACCGIQEVLLVSKAITDGLLFIGTDAGESNTGANDVIGLGTDAAGANSGIDVVAMGNSAALNNTGSDVVAIGNNALSGNTANDAIGIGETAGQNQTGADATLIGQGAGFNNIGTEVVAIGKSAGNTNTGDKLHAIGVLAGAANTGDYVVALGSGAAQTNTANYVVALGNAAGAGNAKANSTIISNDCLPSYLNYAAAAAAIVAPSATTGTYLYHDQTTNSIGAVRIP
jgi:hypothetical protein